MRKILLIGWKDLLVTFRDRTALILMLAAPFVLTLGLGLVTGRFSGAGSSSLSDIPVVLVNQDGGQLGEALVEMFQSPGLAGLVSPRLAGDPAAARQLVDQDQAAAALIVPAGFTDSIIPASGSDVAGPLVQLELYANPTRPTSASVVTSIVDEFLSRVEVGRVGSQVAVTQLIGQGLLQPQDAAQLRPEIGVRQAQAMGDSAAIAVKSTTGDGAPIKFDALAYMAPGMALMFLMYTTTNGGRSLLAERAQGTLPRLLVSPTSTSQVLAGKVLGIYLTGVAQMLILILASTLLFNLAWGDPLGVVALVLAAVVGAVGWAMIITAVARTPGQVGTVGSAVMLIFGILGGSFISLDNMPRWFATMSRITPNAWGLDGFATLAMGGRLADVLGPVLGLLAMGGLLFGVAVFVINRRGIAQP